MKRFPYIFINQDLDKFNLEAVLPTLDAYRQKEVLRYRSRTLQVQTAAAWHLLQTALEKTFGIAPMPRVACEEHGKPFFPDFPTFPDFPIFPDFPTFPDFPAFPKGSKIPERPTVHFNLSHCRDAVACAIHYAPVGIDIESVRRPFNMPLARYVLTDSELQQVTEAKDPPLEFIRYWTRKESIVKLTGKGVSDDIKTILERYAHRVTMQQQVSSDGKWVCTVSTFKPDN